MNNLDEEKCVFLQLTRTHTKRRIHLTLKLWTFSYLGARSLSLRVARRTRDVSCERANDLIGCQKVEVGEAGLEGAGARLRRAPEALMGSGREGIEPALTFRPRAAVNKEPF